MEAIAAGEIFDSVLGRAGALRRELDEELFVALRASLRRRLREGWLHAKWPEVMREEKRYFRPIAGPEDVQAGEERYVPGNDKYYVALLDTSSYPINAATYEKHDEWAESRTVYTAEFWKVEKQYAVGDEVRYNLTDRFYKMHTAAAIGIPPTDTTAWGLLKEFDRFIAYDQVLQGGIKATPIGSVIAVTDVSQKLNASWRSVGYRKSENGIQLAEGLTSVWVEFRARPPALKGDVYEAESTYEFGQQAYWERDFWEAQMTVQPGETPGLMPQKWKLLEIPLFLERWLVSAVYADYLEGDGQKEKFAAELAAALDQLAQEHLVLGGQEMQVERTEAVTR